MPSFSTSLEQSIHAALALANEHHHELATLEHLLLALTDEPDAVKVMRACNVDLDELRTSAGGQALSGEEGIRVDLSRVLMAVGRIEEAGALVASGVRQACQLRYWRLSSRWMCASRPQRRRR